MSDPVLSVRGLWVTYRTGTGAVPAVQGVSLDLPRGGSLGLAGESGCGKSTLANAILRLVPAGTKVEGEVILDGQDILTLKPGRLRAVRWTTGAIVFQGALHALNPVQRIERQVAEPMLVHRTVDGQAAAGRRVEELLESVGLPARLAQSYPHQLSGGQRQRVLIAMALACDPQLLIADEPTTALDLMVQAQVLALLQGLRSSFGLSMIFITHDLSVLTSVCEELAVMYAGRVVERGYAQDVFRDPRHPYTRALSAAFPTIGDHASRMHPSGLGGDPPDPAHLPSGCAFHPRCPVALDSCASTAVDLVPAGDGRHAACVLVGRS
jgi:peptide/nickel transport system ATP-binding protein